MVFEWGLISLKRDIIHNRWHDTCEAECPTHEQIRIVVQLDGETGGSWLEKASRRRKTSGGEEKRESNSALNFCRKDTHATLQIKAKNFSLWAISTKGSLKMTVEYWQGSKHRSRTGEQKSLTIKS